MKKNRVSLNEYNDYDVNNDSNSTVQAINAYIILPMRNKEYVDSIIRNKDYQKLASNNSGTLYPGKIIAQKPSKERINRYCGSGDYCVYYIAADSKGSKIMNSHHDGEFYVIDPKAVLDIRPYATKQNTGLNQNIEHGENNSSSSFFSHGADAVAESNMKKNTVKLNEAKLKKIVAESVKKILSETLASPSSNTLMKVKELYDYLYDVQEESDATSALYKMITNWLNKQYPGEMNAAIGG